MSFLISLLKLWYSFVSWPQTLWLAHHLSKLGLMFPFCARGSSNIYSCAKFSWKCGSVLHSNRSGEIYMDSFQGIKNHPINLVLDLWTKYVIPNLSMRSSHRHLILSSLYPEFVSRRYFLLIDIVLCTCHYLLHVACRFIDQWLEIPYHVPLFHH